MQSIIYKTHFFIFLDLLARTHTIIPKTISDFECEIVDSTIVKSPEGTFFIVDNDTVFERAIFDPENRFSIHFYNYAVTYLDVNYRIEGDLKREVSSQFICNNDDSKYKVRWDDSNLNRSVEILGIDGEFLFGTSLYESDWVENSDTLFFQMYANGYCDTIEDDISYNCILKDCQVYPQLNPQHEVQYCINDEWVKIEPNATNLVNGADLDNVKIRQYGGYEVPKTDSGWFYSPLYNEYDKELTFIITAYSGNTSECPNAIDTVRVSFEDQSVTYQKYNVSKIHSYCGNDGAVGGIQIYRGFPLTYWWSNAPNDKQVITEEEELFLSNVNPGIYNLFLQDTLGCLIKSLSHKVKDLSSTLSDDLIEYIPSCQGCEHNLNTNLTSEEKDSAVWENIGDGTYQVLNSSTTKYQVSEDATEGDTIFFNVLTKLSVICDSNRIRKKKHAFGIVIATYCEDSLDQNETEVNFEIGEIYNLNNTHKVKVDQTVDKRYNDLTSSVITTSPGQEFYLKNLLGSTDSTFWRIYFNTEEINRFDNALQEFEYYDNLNAGKFKIPASLELGTYRMRVVYSNENLKDPCNFNEGTQTYFFDFDVQIEKRDTGFVGTLDCPNSGFENNGTDDVVYFYSEEDTISNFGVWENSQVSTFPVNTSPFETSNGENPTHVYVNKQLTPSEYTHLELPEWTNDQILQLGNTLDSKGSYGVQFRIKLSDNQPFFRTYLNNYAWEAGKKLNSYCSIMLFDQAGRKIPFIDRNQNEYLNYREEKYHLLENYAGQAITVQLMLTKIEQEESVLYFDYSCNMPDTLVINKSVCRNGVIELRAKFYGKKHYWNNEEELGSINRYIQDVEKDTSIYLRIVLSNNESVNFRYDLHPDDDDIIVHKKYECIGDGTYRAKLALNKSDSTLYKVSYPNGKFLLENDTLWFETIPLYPYNGTLGVRINDCGFKRLNFAYNCDYEGCEVVPEASFYSSSTKCIDQPEIVLTNTSRNLVSYTSLYEEENSKFKWEHNGNGTLSVESKRIAKYSPTFEEYGDTIEIKLIAYTFDTDSINCPHDTVILKITVPKPGVFDLSNMKITKSICGARNASVRGIKISNYSKNLDFQWKKGESNLNDYLNVYDIYGDEYYSLVGTSEEGCSILLDSLYVPDSTESHPDLIVIDTSICVSCEIQLPNAIDVEFDSIWWKTRGVGTWLSSNGEITSYKASLKDSIRSYSLEMYTHFDKGCEKLVEDILIYQINVNNTVPCGAESTKGEYETNILMSFGEMSLEGSEYSAFTDSILNTKELYNNQTHRIIPIRKEVDNYLNFETNDGYNRSSPKTISIYVDWNKDLFFDAQTELWKKKVVNKVENNFKVECPNDKDNGYYAVRVIADMQGESEPTTINPCITGLGQYVLDYIIEVRDSESGELVNYGDDQFCPFSEDEINNQFNENDFCLLPATNYFQNNLRNKIACSEGGIEMRPYDSRTVYSGNSEACIVPNQEDPTFAILPMTVPWGEENSLRLHYSSTSGKVVSYRKEWIVNSQKPILNFNWALVSKYRSGLQLMVMLFDEKGRKIKGLDRNLTADPLKLNERYSYIFESWKQCEIDLSDYRGNKITAIFTLAPSLSNDSGHAYLNFFCEDQYDDLKVQYVDKACEIDGVIRVESPICAKRFLWSNGDTTAYSVYKALEIDQLISLKFTLENGREFEILDTIPQFESGEIGEPEVVCGAKFKTVRLKIKAIDPVNVSWSGLFDGRIEEENGELNLVSRNYNFNEKLDFNVTIDEGCELSKQFEIENVCFYPDSCNVIPHSILSANESSCGTDFVPLEAYGVNLKGKGAMVNWELNHNGSGDFLDNPESVEYKVSEEDYGKDIEFTLVTKSVEMNLCPNDTSRIKVRIATKPEIITDSLVELLDECKNTKTLSNIKVEWGTAPYYYTLSGKNFAPQNLPDSIIFDKTRNLTVVDDKGCLARYIFTVFVPSDPLKEIENNLELLTSK